MMKVYLDNAATTALSKEALESMMPYLTQVHGNPSSFHSFGRNARSAVEKAREQVANAIGALPEEIIFTGGGTESDNTVIMGTAQRLKDRGNHIITTAVEHHAVLHPCEELEKRGFEVTYLEVDEFGAVSPEQVEAAIKDNTILVTIMFANNEVGTIMPIAQIGEICRKHNVWFHTDAVQAVGHVPVNVKEMNIDMLSLSAHKFHGPKGIGALYVKKGIRLPSLIMGGAQEKNRRAGTENVAAIVGMGTAIELAVANMENSTQKMLTLRDRLMNGIESRISEVKLNGHRTNRLPNNVNYSIKYIEGEGILLHLDLNGVAASSGSACTSGSLDPSHVLLAMGLTHEVAHGSVRLTLSESNTEEEIDYALNVLEKAVTTLRAMSPLYNK
ncbi:MAG: cysteine desulfurase NifS [Clostridia bacterium]|nr:cysteine desulfurase NifS [Clostridia bacterium]